MHFYLLEMPKGDIFWFSLFLHTNEVHENQFFVAPVKFANIAISQIFHWEFWLSIKVSSGDVEVSIKFPRHERYQPDIDI